MRSHSLFIVSGLLVLCCSPALGQTAGRAPAEEVDPLTPTGRDINFQVSGGGEYQMPVDIDAGGDFNVFRFAAGLGIQRQFNDDFRGSVHINYGLDWYDFGGGAMGLPGGADPWDDIHTLTAYGLLSYDLTDSWTVFGGPVFQSSRESGASFGDSITAGGAFGVTYRWSRDLTIGGGLVVTTRLEESVRVRPILVIDWNFADDFQLRSQTGNIANRTGVELIYGPGRTWEFAVGAAAQWSRFRLDEDGPAPGGVGQDSSLPLWFRATWRATDRLSVDGIAGLNLAGNLRVEDMNGAPITTSDYDMAPFVGFFASYRF